jgi:hypothetical protein
MGSDAGKVGERITVTRLDVAVPDLDPIETRSQRLEGSGVHVALENLVASLADVRSADAPEVAELEALRDVCQDVIGGAAGAALLPAPRQGNKVDLQVERDC